jgi:hypothetical protein
MKGKGLARTRGELSDPGPPAVNCSERLTFLGMQESIPVGGESLLRSGDSLKAAENAHAPLKESRLRSPVYTCT